MSAKEPPRKRWHLIARFTTPLNVDAVAFVKMNVEDNTLRCDCDEFALNSLHLTFECRHTLFCDERVVDDLGGVELIGVMPTTVRKDPDLVDLWIERHVKEYKL